MTPHFLANAKAYAALVGAICTALLGVYAADTTVGQVLTVVSIVATAIGTWRVPNTPRRRYLRGERGPELTYLPPGVHVRPGRTPGRGDTGAAPGQYKA